MTGPRPDKQLCGAKTRAGGGHACKLAAGLGTDHLGYGRCKWHGGAHRNGRVAAAREEAAAVATRLGVAIDTDPHAALKASVDILAGQVAFLQGKAEAIEEGEELEAGLLPPVVRTLNGVLEQLSRSAKLAIDAGVAERLVRLDEMQQGKMAALIGHVLDALDLTGEQRAIAQAAMADWLDQHDVFDERPRELAA